MASKGKKTKQEDDVAAAKMKIMRERHSTWMKQREQALGTKGVQSLMLLHGVPMARQSPPSAGRNNPLDSARSQKSTNSSRTHINTKKASTPGGVSQQQSHPKLRAPPHPITSASPSPITQKNELYDNRQYYTPNKSDSGSEEDPLDMGVDASESISQHRPITPGTINALADTVAERLRIRMKGESNRVESKDSNSGMSSHDCSQCGSLMTPPLHTPMAVIPCGHTFCKTCIAVCQKCPTCQSKILSTAVNTVLQQIIANFKEEKEKERLEQLEEQARKYVSQYEGLTMRTEILTGEAESIIKHMESITQELMERKQDMRKLERDDADIRQRIEELEHELKNNSDKYKNCHEYCNELEEKYSQEKQQLAMVEDTIKTIKKSKERVKIMVHNFAPNLKLDQGDEQD